MLGVLTIALLVELSILEGALCTIRVAATFAEKIDGTLLFSSMVTS